MDIIGIICEYNPFHNGHVYHINKIKEMYPDSLIICITSTSFLQRGEISILNKWDKTSICLNHGINIVLELPFVFSSQSADIFAYGAISTLNAMKVNKIVFGSELNDINILTTLAKKQINNNDYETKVKEYLDKGFNYPTAMSKAINSNINTPNDLLGISYIKEIIKNNYEIEPISIKRTNDYHGSNFDGNIISASKVRSFLKENENITDFVPTNIEKYIYKNIDLFPFIKYKIIASKNILNSFQTVDEGIENRLLSKINKVNTLEDFIKEIKTKRYTYNKINRMLIHILTSFTKEEAKNLKTQYVRVLGFNKKGKEYLNKIKKITTLPIITSYKDINSKILDIEYRVTNLYSLFTKDYDLILRELKKPIIK